MKIKKAFFTVITFIIFCTSCSNTDSSLSIDSKIIETNFTETTQSSYKFDGSNYMNDNFSLTLNEKWQIVEDADNLFDCMFKYTGNSNGNLSGLLAIQSNFLDGNNLNKTTAVFASNFKMLNYSVLSTETVNFNGISATEQVFLFKTDSSDKKSSDIAWAEEKEKVMVYTICIEADADIYDEVRNEATKILESFKTL